MDRFRRSSRTFRATRSKHGRVEPENIRERKKRRTSISEKNSRRPMISHYDSRGTLSGRSSDIPFSLMSRYLSLTFIYLTPITDCGWSLIVLLSLRSLCILRPAHSSITTSTPRCSISKGISNASVSTQMKPCSPIGS